VSLKLIHALQVPCWPWHLHWIPREEVQYATCRTCERDIAQPMARSKEVPVCIYCAMESGLLPLEERPFHELWSEP
jgi:hypothetical protein